jgi:hypothetical protein
MRRGQIGGRLRDIDCRDCLHTSIHVAWYNRTYFRSARIFVRGGNHIKFVCCTNRDTSLVCLLPDEVGSPSVMGALDDGSGESGILWYIASGHVASWAGCARFQGSLPNDANFNTIYGTRLSPAVSRRQLNRHSNWPSRTKPRNNNSNRRKL